MKKKHWVMLAAGAAAGAWCVYRDKKYPVRRSLRFANKFTVPGFVLNADTARLANRVLTRMRMALPLPPQGIERRGTQIPSEDGTPIRLTIYRPKALDWAAPCLVYFHGGGFCLGDAGYIHCYAAQYAEGARCMVVFVQWNNGPELDDKFKNAENRIFELGETSKNSEEGTGIGLWIARETVERYDGTIAVSDQEQGFGLDIYLKK